MKQKIKAFWKGFNSIFNIQGNSFELPEIKSDSENIKSDWDKILSKQVLDNVGNYAIAIAKDETLNYLKQKKNEYEVNAMPKMFINQDENGKYYTEYRAADTSKNSTLDLINELIEERTKMIRNIYREAK